MQFNLLPFLTRYTNHAGFSNDTPREYLCNLGPDGRRRDADDRPELCRGAVEFIASKEFLVCPCLTECSCHFLLARLVNHSVVLVVISLCIYILYWWFSLYDWPACKQTCTYFAPYLQNFHIIVSHNFYFCFLIWYHNSDSDFIHFRSGNQCRLCTSSLLMSPWMLYILVQLLRLAVRYPRLFLIFL
jgi:hypothetical protein